MHWITHLQNQGKLNLESVIVPVNTQHSGIDEKCSSHIMKKLLKDLEFWFSFLFIKSYEWDSFSKLRHAIPQCDCQFVLSYYVATLKKTPCRKSLNWMSHHSSATRLVEHTYLKREFIVTILKIRLQAKSAQKYVYNLGALVFTLLRLFSSSLAFIACMLDSPEGFTQK